MTVLDAAGQPVATPAKGAIEVPPNKAIAAGGSATIGSVVVGLGLYYFGHDTPPEIVGLWIALANTVIVPLAVYLTPHGAFVKE